MEGVTGGLPEGEVVVPSVDGGGAATGFVGVGELEKDGIGVEVGVGVGVREGRSGGSSGA